MQSPTTTAAGAVATDETDRLISSDKVVGTAVYNPGASTSARCTIS